MRRIAAVVLLFAATSAPAQTVPSSTEEGTRALDELTERCIATGGLKQDKHPRTGAPVLSLGDGAKLKEAVAADRARLTPTLRDEILARFGNLNRLQNPALVALLRAVGEAMEDDRALAFAALASGKQATSRDNLAEAMRCYGEARDRFAKLRDRAWEAYSRHTLAALHWAAGDLKGARDQFLELIPITFELHGERDVNVGLCRGYLGSVYNDLREPKAALEQFREALSIFREAPGHDNLVAMCLDNMGTAYHSLRDLRRAMECAREGLGIRERIHPEGDSTIANSHNTIGGIFAAGGEYRDALRHLLLSLEIHTKHSPREGPQVFATHNSLGYVYHEMGDTDRAQEHYQAALKIVRALNPERHPDVAVAYNNLAGVFTDQGDYDKALDYYKRAMAIRRAIFGERSLAVADSLNNIGSVYHDLDRFDEASEAQAEALSIRRERLGERSPEVAQSHNNLGSLYQDRGDYDRALEEFERALDIWKKVRDPQHLDIAVALNNIGGVHEMRKEYPKALQKYEEALAIRRATYGASGPLVAQSHHNIGSMLNRLGRRDEALASYDLALAALGRRDDLPAADKMGADDLQALPLTVKALRDRARTLEKELGERPGPKPLRRCLRAYQLASDVLDRLRDQVIESRASKVRVAERAVGLTAPQVGIAWRLAEAEGSPDGRLVAFATAERGSARVFLESLGRARAPIVGGIPEGLRAEEDNLRAQARELDARIARGLAVPARDRDTEEIRRLLAARAGSEQAWLQLTHRMEREYPQYAAMKYPQPCTIDQARVCLAADEVALVYVPGVETSYLLVVSHDTDAATGGLTVHELPSVEQITKLVSALTRSRVLADGDKARELGAEACRTLLGPAAKQIEGKGLLIVPGGTLGYLPFELLVEPGADGATHWLVEGHRIRYAPSLTALHFARLWEATRARPERSLWALGDPIFQESDPRLASKADLGRGAKEVLAKYRGSRSGASFERLGASGEEVRHLADLLDAGPQDLLVGRDATEAAVKMASAAGQMARYRYIHFATHGLLGLADGLPPSLVLSLVGDQRGEDGFLTLGEVTGLRLNADLVVLSACQTGQGRLYNAEGVSSLARAFLYAGSRGVLCSLWQVADQETSDLMVDVYAGLKAGKSAADALRDAQLRMIDAGQPPLYWAPFILIGN